MKYDDFEKLSFDNAVVGDEVLVITKTRKGDSWVTTRRLGTITKITPKRRDITVYVGGESYKFDLRGRMLRSGDWLYGSTWRIIELLDAERFDVLVDGVEHEAKVADTKAMLLGYVANLRRRDFFEGELEHVAQFLDATHSKGWFSG